MPEQEQPTGQQAGETPKTGQDGSQDTNMVPASEVDKWKSLARKNEERAKENYEKAKRFDELEESKKDELQKEREAREELQRKLDERDKSDAAREAKDRIAKEYGVPAEALRGSTEEALEEHAKTLQPLFKKDPAPSSNGQGKVGDKISGKEQITSRDELSTMTPEQIEQARNEGRLDQLLGKP